MVLTIGRYLTFHLYLQILSSQTLLHVIKVQPYKYSLLYYHFNILYLQKISVYLLYLLMLNIYLYLILYFIILINITSPFYQIVNKKLYLFPMPYP